MADIGLNQNLTVRGRQFHIQTATNIDDGSIRTEVFEKGRLLYSENIKYERRDFKSSSGVELRLHRIVDRFHQSAIAGLETLFELSLILENQDKCLAHQRLGAIFLSLHIFDKAEDHLLRTIDMKPDCYGAYIMLSKCYYLQKRFKQAAKTLEPLLKLKISYPDLYNLLGLISLEKKKYVQSLNHFMNAIKLNPKYKEAFLNLAIAILQRISFLKMQNRKEEIQKNFKFLNVILSKLHKIGTKEEKGLIVQIKQAYTNRNYGKIQSIIYDYRNKHFYQKMPVEVLGYEFYLWLRYLPDRLDYDTLCHFEDKISQTLANNPDYPDMWSYLALIHLMLCRDYFLKGLDNFKEANKINPEFTKARKNLRLVENDGREFLALIKTIVKD